MTTDRKVWAPEVFPISHSAAYLNWYRSSFRHSGIEAGSGVCLSHIPAWVANSLHSEAK